MNFRSRIATFVTIILAWSALDQQHASGQPGAVSPVVVSQVKSVNQASSQSFIGTLVPIQKSVVGSAVSGRVTAIHVDNGDAVSMLENQFDVDNHPLGQPIVQLRTVSLEIEISAAEVELKLRQNAEEELKKSLPTEIDAARATVNEVNARVKYARSDYERLNELADKRGGITRREVDEALSTFNSRSQLKLAAESRLKQLLATQDVRLAQANSRVEAQLAELDRLRELKEKYTIRAPFAGYVTSKMTEVGQWVSQGDDVIEIVAIDPIELIINVPQTYIGKLQHSLDSSRTSNSDYEVQVKIDGVSEILFGRVVRVVPQADLRSRSFPVIVRLDNPDHQLKPGMLASASLFVGQNDDVLLVKKDALVLGGSETLLYVVDDNPTDNNQTVRPVPVKIGAATDDWIQVTGPISAGQRVVIEGNERLRPGQIVQITNQVEVPKSDKQ